MYMYTHTGARHPADRQGEPRFTTYSISIVTELFAMRPLPAWRGGCGREGRRLPLYPPRARVCVCVCVCTHTFVIFFNCIKLY